MKEFKINIRGKIFLIIGIVLFGLDVQAMEEYEFLSREIEKNIIISTGLLLMVIIFFSLVKKILKFLKINMPRGWAVFTGIVATLLGTACVFIFKIKEPGWLLLIFPFLIGFATGNTYTIPVPWPPFKEKLQNQVEYDIWAEKIAYFHTTLFGRVIDSDPFIPYVFRIWWFRQNKYYSTKYLYSSYLTIFFAFIFFCILWFSFLTHEFSPWITGIAASMGSSLLGNILGDLKKYMDAEKIRDKFTVEADRFWNEFENRLFDWVSNQPWVGRYPNKKIDEKEINSAIEKLGLQRPINEAKIRLHYWELVKKYHYLMMRKKGNLEIDKIENEFREIFRAYQTLQGYYFYNKFQD
ncbi:MAG: hypothetical protein N3A00_03175 [Thermodesulfovibrio sp.]|nr:hypothetical protein [Thermodesulfovibrio sp.]